MADQSVTGKPGERFRRNELAYRLRSLADLIEASPLPVHRFDRTPLLEFQMADAAEVDMVASALGWTAKRFKTEYFTGIENAELRVRWTATVADDFGLDYSRADDGEAPQKLGEREPLHTGAVTESGLVEETLPSQPPAMSTRPSGSSPAA